MTIKESYQKVKQKQSTENKLQELYTQKDEFVHKTESLKAIMLKEQKDVDSLEKGGLASFFYELRGKKEQKLDKERAEAYEAKAKYDNAAYQLAEINKNIDIYEKTLSALGDCEKEYEIALKERQAELKTGNPEIIQLEEDIVSAQHLQKEIAEALLAGNTAKETAMQILSSLDDADSWATFDLFGGGLIADMVKYESLDKAEKLLMNLQTELNSFKTELTDVKIQCDIQISIDHALKTADYFFDNIFTDYAVKDSISSSLSQVNETVSQIDKTLAHLDSLLSSEQEKEKSAKDAMERIILEHSDM